MTGQNNLQTFTLVCNSYIFIFDCEAVWTRVSQRKVLSGETLSKSGSY